MGENLDVNKLVNNEENIVSVRVLDSMLKFLLLHGYFDLRNDAARTLN